jgi:DNA-binding beta-propeller fold protein YncE
MKMKGRILLTVLSLFVGWGGASMAQAAGVTFQVTDNPGSWFECTTSTSASFGCVHQALGSDSTTGKSLAVIKRGESITFQSGGGRANTIHTVVSLIYPTPASPPPTGFSTMPFDTDVDENTSSAPIVPNELGLHVFFCDIHPYMFATVIVVDPKIPTGTLSPVGSVPLELGSTVDLHKIVAETLPGLPTASDLALRLVHTFFIITNPANWQQYSTVDTLWKPAYPGVMVTAHVKGGGAATLNLDELLRGYFGEGGPTAANHSAPYLKTLSHPVAPATPGVGQVWVDTQFESMHEKSKPGTATAVNTTSWTVERKVGLPTHGTNSGDGMNNPHNMWTDRNQKVIYQTEWFDHYLAVFDRKTGAWVNRLEAGLAPAHVMTRTNNDQVHVSQNGDNNVREFDSLAHGNGFLKDIPMVPTVDPVTGEEQHAHPHAHWMSADGSMMVSPNVDTENTTVYGFKSHTGHTAPVGHFPIATGMMPDSSKYYVANFLDSSITVVTISGGVPTVAKTINLLASYLPYYDGLWADATVHAPQGALPIQIPVSPDGKYAIVANTMAAKILVIDTKTDTVVASLACDAGCHGAQFGAKKGGGYYAYVSSKFSNRLIVVDPKGGSDAAIVGSVLLTATGTTAIDGSVSNYPGMGGQGVLPIPVVYNGWVQHLPEEWAEKLTYKQRHPIGENPE